MKLAAKLVLTERGMAHLKKCHKIGNSYYIAVPAEYLWSIGDAESIKSQEFLIYAENSSLVIVPYTGQGELYLDKSGKTP